MSIVTGFRAWLVDVRRRRLERYAAKRGFITPEELEEAKQNAAFPGFSDADRAFAKPFDSDDGPRR